MDQPLQQTQEYVKIPLYDIERGGLSFNQQMLMNCMAVRVKSTVSQNDDVFVEQRESFKTSTISIPAGVLATTGANPTIQAAINLSQIGPGAANYCAVCLWNSGGTTFYLYTVNMSSNAWLLIGSAAAVATGDKVHLSEYTTRVVAPTTPGQTAPVLVMVLEHGGTGASKIYYVIATGSPNYTFPAALVDLTATAAAPWNASWLSKVWVGPAVELNGRLYIMSKDGYIMCSDLGSITSWTESSFIPCEAYPDNGIGLCRYKHMLIAFGGESMEFFADVGNLTGAPIQRTEQAFIKLGCYSSQSYLNVDDTVYWIARSSAGSFQLWRLDGYTPTKMSHSGIETVLQNAPGSNRRAALKCVTMNGRRQLFTFIPFENISNQFPWIFALSEGTPFQQTVTDGVTWTGSTYIGANSPTWVLNVTDNTWWLYGLGSGNAAYNFEPCANNYDNSINVAAVTTCFFSTGAVGVLDGLLANSGTDLGDSFPSIWASNPLDFNTGRRKFMSRLTVMAETNGNNGVSLPFLMWSDTAGAHLGSMATATHPSPNTVVPWGATNVSAVFNQQYQWRRLGAFRHRQLFFCWQTAIGTSQYIRLTGIEAQIAQGTS